MRLIKENQDCGTQNVVWYHNFLFTVSEEAETGSGSLLYGLPGPAVFVDSCLFSMSIWLRLSPHRLADRLSVRMQETGSGVEEAEGLAGVPKHGDGQRLGRSFTRQMAYHETAVTPDAEACRCYLLGASGKQS